MSSVSVFVVSKYLCTDDVCIELAQKEALYLLLVLEMYNETCIVQDWW